MHDPSCLRGKHRIVHPLQYPAGLKWVHGQEGGVKPRGAAALGDSGAGLPEQAICGTPIALA